METAVGLRWVREDRPLWDEAKQRVIGGAPKGALDIGFPPGSALPGDWWRAVDEADRTVGYGWLDATWGGDAEVLLAVDPDAWNRGVGGFVLDHLELEAGSRGLNYVYNTVRETHPDRERVHDWLAARGYMGGTADTALRKRVGSTSDLAGRSRPATPFDEQSMSSARPPGHEETGGYVNIEEHRY